MNTKYFTRMKKKINPSDLDLSPQRVGDANGSFAGSTPERVESNDLHCSPTLHNLCVTNLCATKDRTCGDTGNFCETIACQPTNNVNGCVDSLSNAQACCANTGIDCLQTEVNCRTIDCPVRTEQMDCLSELCPPLATEAVVCKDTNENCAITVDGCNITETKRC